MRVDVTLETTRLRLRAYREADIPELVPLIGAREIAATTGRIPHPYTVEDARQFLIRIETEREARMAITLRESDRGVTGNAALWLRRDEPASHIRHAFRQQPRVGPNPAEAWHAL